LKEEQVQHPLMNLISTGLAKPDTAYYGTWQQASWHYKRKSCERQCLIQMQCSLHVLPDFGKAKYEMWFLGFSHTIQWYWIELKKFIILNFLICAILHMIK
jgi:hypothetical protein